MSELSEAEERVASAKAQWLAALARAKERPRRARKAAVRAAMERLLEAERALDWARTESRGR